MLFNKELIFDGIQINTISLELSYKLKYLKNLIIISMNYCNLDDIYNLPIWPNLVKLQLMDNNLDKKSILKIIEYKNLRSLSIGGNNFSNFDDIKPLKNLYYLQQLDLSESKLSEMDNYRKNIFEIIPHLVSLDNYDINNKSIILDNNIYNNSEKEIKIDDSISNNKSIKNIESIDLSNSNEDENGIYKTNINLDSILKQEDNKTKKNYFQSDSSNSINF